MKLNPNAPLYYVKSGRPVSVIETLPVVKYRVQYSNGCTAELTEDEMDATLTNERPRYKFATNNLARGRMIVEGNDRHVTFKIRRSMVDSPAQDLNKFDLSRNVAPL
jgi:hypothetical protein